MGLQANAPAMLVYFPHLYLFWALLANIPAVPAHFISLGFLNPFTSSLSLLLPQAFC